MFLFILAIILFLTGIAAIVVARSFKKSAAEKKSNYDKTLGALQASGRSAYRSELPANGDSEQASARWTSIGGYAVLVLAVLCLLGSITFKVGAKEYGVLTTFGKPSNQDFGSGLHLKAPWQKAISVDGKRKVYGFGGDDTQGFDKAYKCIQTVIGNGTPSCVVATIRWQIEKNQASVTYANYGTGDPTEHFGEAVIRAQASQVIPIVVRGYNPISQLTVLKGQATGESAENASFAPDYPALSKQAQDLLQSRVEGEATIQSFAISAVPLDSATEQKLSQFIQEQAKTRTALQAIETNTNQALANQKLEQSLERSPGLLVSKCLDEVADGIAKGYQFNAGFSCFGSGSVVIPSAPSSK